MAKNMVRILHVPIKVIKKVFFSKTIQWNPFYLLYQTDLSSNYSKNSLQCVIQIVMITCYHLDKINLVAC